MNAFDKFLGSAEVLAGKYLDSRRPVTPAPAASADKPPAARPAWLVPAVVVVAILGLGFLFFRKP